MAFISDSYNLFIRWMKKLVRNPILIFFSLFQPIIFLVLFTQLFSKFSVILGLGLATRPLRQRASSYRTRSQARFNLARRW